MPTEITRQVVQRLFIDHVDELKGFVASLVPDPELVDDVVQETFVAVTARAAHYDPRQSFKTWLFIVARDKLREVGGRADAEARPFADDVLECWWRATRDSRCPGIRCGFSTSASTRLRRRPGASWCCGIKTR
jgi:RNA polymerase sigma factor (sigma-70 family)